MKEFTVYQCEICNERFDTLEECLNCESRGIDVPLSKGKQGRYENNVSGMKYDIDVYISSVKRHGHFFIYTLKAFDCNNKKYVVNEIWGNKNSKVKWKYDK